MVVHLVADGQQEVGGRDGVHGGVEGVLPSLAVGGHTAAGADLGVAEDERVEDVVVVGGEGVLLGPAERVGADLPGVGGARLQVGDRGVVPGQAGLVEGRARGSGVGDADSAVLGGEADLLAGGVRVRVPDDIPVHVGGADVQDHVRVRGGLRGLPDGGRRGRSDGEGGAEDSGGEAGGEQWGFRATTMHRRVLSVTMNAMGGGEGGNRRASQGRNPVRGEPRLDRMTSRRPLGQACTDPWNTAVKCA